MANSGPVVGAASVARQPDAPGYWHSETTIEIPKQDIVSYAFGRAREHDQDQPIYVDAVDCSKFITVSEARQKTTQIAAGLQAVGLKPGDCVCVHTFNMILYPLLYLGIIAAGGIVIGTNPAYTSKELTDHFGNTGPKYVIAHAKYLDVVQQAIGNCGIPKTCVFLLGCDGEPAHHGYHTFEQLVTYSNQFTNFSGQSVHDESQAAIYGATSGTTGSPKAAILPHRYVVAQAAIIEDLYEERLKTQKVKQILSLPLFHAFASQLSLVLPLRLGITTYILERFDSVHFINAVKKHGITDTALVPTIIASLSQLPASELQHLQSLRRVVCAGSVMNPEVQERFNNQLHPEAQVVQCWGTTELGWVSTFPPGVRDNSGSVGRLMANIKLKIVDDQGNTVTEEGVSGEGCIISPAMMLKYRGSDALNKDTFDEEGFYRTGDSVYIENGRIHISDRIKDIMKVNGWQVSPQELQDVIMKLAPLGIKDCAVVGHDKVGPNGIIKTLPRAFVVKAPDCSLTADDVKDQVSANLIGYKRLTGGVFFVDSIPRNPTGKILRRFLVAREA